jgi:GNAT superfamily N-acetyltransferase
VLHVTIDIRLATRADVPALSSLVEASVRGLSRGYYTEEEIERSVRKVFGVDTQLVDDGTYFAAEEGGVLIGCGGWSRRATLYGGDQAKLTEDVEVDPADSPARIRAFFVHPDHARRGIGRRLLAACESAARDFGFARAELVATLPGVPLYSALGFQPLEPVAVDLGDGHVLRCIRMAKNITSPSGRV